MILVTLGTQDKEFTRLLEAVDREIKNKNIKEKVVVQAGYTKYQSKNMAIFDLIPSDELENLVKQCRVLITHGGVGSILMGIKNNKPIIAAARLKEYREHTNNHQKQIIEEFKSRGYIIELEDFNKLDKVLKEIKDFKQKKFVSHTDKFIKNIEDYIKEDNHTSWFNKYLNLASYGYRGILLSIINILSFMLLVNHLDILISNTISFVITCLFQVILNLICQNKKNTVKFIFVNILVLLFDLFILILFNNFLDKTLIAKIISNVTILIITYIVGKILSMKETKILERNA